MNLLLLTHETYQPNAIKNSYFFKEFLGLNKLSSNKIKSEESELKFR